MAKRSTAAPFPNVRKYERAAADPRMWSRMVNAVDFAAGNGCWEWRGTVADTGYGIVSHRFGELTRNLLAHRLALHIAGRPVPSDLSVDHLCRNRLCVNPDHLEAVTPAENALRGEGCYAVNARKTHCVHGHEFTPDNTAVYIARGRPTRTCRTCMRLRANAKKSA